MEKFQRIIIIVAVILLIISLVLIGILMNNNKKTEQWPPLIGDCPDYWIDTSGNGSKCVNVQNLGKCTSSPDPGIFSMDFTTSDYIGSRGLCNKYNWANTCGVSWDGITYGVENPCHSSTQPPLESIAGIVISVLFVTCLIIFAIYYYFFSKQVASATSPSVTSPSVTSPSVTSPSVTSPSATPPPAGSSKVASANYGKVVSEFVSKLLFLYK